MGTWSSTTKSDHFSNRKRFTGKESSSGIMKSVNPLSSKKNTREDELARLRSIGSQHEPIRSKLKNMGPICKSRKEAAAAFLQSSIEEEIDLDMRFGEEKCSDDSTYTWLSSDSTTSSSFWSKAWTG